MGASFHLHNHNDVSLIKALDSVASIWPITLYSRPNPRVDSIINLSAPANETENGTYVDQFPPHVMTGVDKLHAQGYTGKGVTIAIIDTGVDYRYDYYFSLHSNILPMNYIDIQH
jgi:subtilisin family serine protease